METNSLWGDIGLDEPVQTPTTLLKEQADALTNLTKGILRGEITLWASGETLFNSLDIVAPYIDNYTFQVLRVRSNIYGYPVSVISDFEEIVCENQEELAIALGRILGSERVRKAIRSLVAQSKAV